MKKMRVAVLMSTYNGARFIQQQLDSLLQQDYPEVDIFIRDDGSSDSTCDIVQSYVNLFPNIFFTQGENLGFIRSFLQMLCDCDGDFGYYFFCDQDDVWLPQKVSQAVKKMQHHDASDKALLYCSHLQCVDKNLMPLYASGLAQKEKVGFGNALVQNVVTGCTAALNARARHYIVSRELPAQALAHDWWMYLVVSCFGELIVDENTYILYRQHGANTIGMQRTGWAERVRKFLVRKRSRNIFDQARDFLKLYGAEMSGEKKKVVQTFVSYPGTMKQSFKLGAANFYWRSTWLDSCMLRILIILRWY